MQNFKDNLQGCELEVEDLGAGSLKIYQARGLYRFTSDSVLLAKFAKAKANDIAADFCAGGGIVGFYFYALNQKIKSMTLFEMQKDLSDLSRASIGLNALENFFAINCRVQDIENKYNNCFSLILCNPPYEPKGSGFVNSDGSIAACRSEIELSLDELLQSAAKRLKFGGRLALMHRADRLAELMHLMTHYKIQPKRMQLIQSTEHADPYLVLIEGVRGGAKGMKVLQTHIVNKKTAEKVPDSGKNRNF